MACVNTTMQALE